ncbi:MAG: hypothetical protein ABJC39_10080 [Chloroflexota bacterium]
MTDDVPPTSTDGARSPLDPGERRRLARPPSDRYRAAEAAAAEADRPDPAASIARGVAVAAVVAIVGAAAIVILGGVLTLTDFLLIVAGFSGGGIGVALRWGAGDRFGRHRDRAFVALALAFAAVALGQLGLWQYARIEGGVLGLLDYLGQAFGPLVLLEFAAAGVVAWLAAR